MVQQKKTPFINKISENTHLKHKINFFWKQRFEFLSGALMLVGIVLSFFYRHIGGLLVGLSVGICFFDEIYAYFLQWHDFYSKQGPFKTLMKIALILYFLIIIPAFMIATAIGCGVIYLARLSQKK